MNMDIEPGGTGGTCPPLFKGLEKVSLLCSLVALLENLENAKMNRKIHVSGDFKRSKFQNFPEEHAHGSPSWFAFLISRLIAQFQKPCQGVPHSMCPPTFKMLPTPLAMKVVLDLY